ncbi:hypothetical protein HQ560_16720, partial [bacterium]|nr:hypothetical protein [bacterium]
FYDERTTPAGLDAAALARIAKLGGATTGMNFERRADREAALAARRMFTGPGAPGQAALTRLLNADRMAERAATEAMAALDEQSDGAKARELAKRGNLYLLASLAKRLDALEDLTLLAALAEKVEDPEVARRAAHAYVAATGKLPTTKRAMKLKQPHLLLMGPLRKAFIEPRESFTDLAPFLTDMSGSTPHLALAFARTALKSETKAAARTALGRLCTKIEATRTGIKRHEERALIELAATEPGHELGRQALLALVQSGCSLAEQPAVEYMVAVGAGIVPDVEPAPPGGGLRLSDTQMAILEGIARCSENEASDAAVALLLRVSGPQRETVRKYLRFPPPTRESSIKAIETIQKGAPKEVVALTRTLAKHPALYPVAEHLVEAYYRYTREKVAPALRMALLEYLVYVAARPYAFSDTFVRLAQSTDKAERSAAIASIGRVAHTIAVYPERLKPLIAKETDPKLKAQLEAARRKAQEALLIDPRRPSPQHH